MSTLHQVAHGTNWGSASRFAIGLTAKTRTAIATTMTTDRTRAGWRREREKVGGNEVGLEGAFHREMLGRVINVTHADLG
jgi:hypothetical protein